MLQGNIDLVGSGYVQGILRNGHSHTYHAASSRDYLAIAYIFE